MITKQQQLEYETGSCGFIMSFIYTMFPSYFQKRLDRKHKRYLHFMNNYKNLGLPNDFSN